MSATLPRITDPDLTVYQGDALQVLQGMPAESVDCVITSPPYWGLRSYGHWPLMTMMSGPDGDDGWQAFQPGRRHRERWQFRLKWRAAERGGVMASNGRAWLGAYGLEPTPDLYVKHSVELFREVRRVLAPHGTCWVNLGDSYNAYNGNRGLSGSTLEGTDRPDARPRLPGGAGLGAKDLKPKDLVGIPWRVAFAIQADGWYLRSDIIWAKPNPMPESVTDRPTKAHEYVFLLSKQPRYWFDQEAVREKAEWSRWGDQTVGNGSNPDGWIKPRTKADIGKTWAQWKDDGAPMRHGLDGAAAHGEGGFATPNTGRNVRSVWEIATQPYPEAHFATYPEELVRRCLLAGCPEGGTVLDPFIGSGTTALVARKHGRKCIGIELNPGYIDLISTRLQQLSLFGESMPSPVTAKPKEGTTP